MECGKAYAYAIEIFDSNTQIPGTVSLEWIDFGIQDDLINSVVVDCTSLASPFGCSNTYRSLDQVTTSILHDLRKQETVLEVDKQLELVCHMIPYASTGTVRIAFY